MKKEVLVLFVLMFAPTLASNVPIDRVANIDGWDFRICLRF